MLLRYVPWFALLSLIWETAQMPLYTLWSEGSPAYIAFAIAHCTAGDVLIGTSSLGLALIVLHEGPLERWRWRGIAALAVLLGTGYTVFSEWMNVSVLGSWAYAESMPTVELAGFELGLSPLVQWMLVPPLAIYAAAKTAGRNNV